MWISKIFTGLIFSLSAFAAAGQLSTSAELEQMHKNARQYVSMGNIDAAITTYKQLLSLLPANTDIATELGNALYIKGDYEQAITALTPLPARTDATDSVYLFLSLSQAAMHNNKKADQILTAGISRFPHSGLLFYEQGNIYMAQHNEPEATKAWLNGIVVAPEFAPNYKNLAASFMTSNQPQWGLICGEQYLLMTHDTTGDEQFKKDLYKCWKTFFDRITELHDSNDYANDMIGLFKQLTPVVSDGISVENLTMVRTRFIMELLKPNINWNRHSEKPYYLAPELFFYQENLIKEGLFDIYNEWLFGSAESPVVFEAWNKFHPNAIEKLNFWRSVHRFNPGGNSFLPQEQTLEATFPKKKKR